MGKNWWENPWNEVPETHKGDTIHTLCAMGIYWICPLLKEFNRGFKQLGAPHPTKHFPYESTKGFLNHQLTHKRKGCHVYEKSEDITPNLGWFTHWEFPWCVANCGLVGDGLPSLPQIILISRGITGDDMYGFEVEGQEWHLGIKKRSGGWLVNNPYLANGKTLNLLGLP